MSSQAGRRSGGQEIWKVNSRAGNLAGGLCAPPPYLLCHQPLVIVYTVFHVFTRKGNKIAIKGNNVHLTVRAEGLCDPCNVYLMLGYLGCPVAMYLVPGCPQDVPGNRMSQPWIAWGN